MNSARRCDVQIGAAPADYQPSRLHSGERIWTETNCYTDLWIETLHALGCDPVPALGAALSARFDGDQWTFIKPLPEDLRAIYGLEVAEMTVWRPVREHVELALARGELLTVEVDSWWLPDTAATDYRRAHVKTSIVPVRLDASSGALRYLHNAGLFELSGEDYDHVFDDPDVVLAPYVETVRVVGDVQFEHPMPIAQAHLGRSEPDAVAQLANGVRRELPLLAERGVDHFHRWTFATLRQCGAGAELAADYVDYVNRQCAADGVASAGAAASRLRELAQLAKSLQFAVARAARGRAVKVDEPLEQMDRLWRGALSDLRSSWLAK